MLYQIELAVRQNLVPFMNIPPIETILFIGMFKIVFHILVMYVGVRYWACMIAHQLLLTIVNLFWLILTHNQRLPRLALCSLHRSQFVPLRSHPFRPSGGLGVPGGFGQLSCLRDWRDELRRVVRYVTTWWEKSAGWIETINHFRDVWSRDLYLSELQEVPRTVIAIFAMPFVFKMIQAIRSSGCIDWSTSFSEPTSHGVFLIPF